MVKNNFSLLLLTLLIAASTAVHAADCRYNPDAPESALWIVAGQSNAAGFADVNNTPLFARNTVFPYVRIWGIFGDDSLAGTGQYPTGTVPGTATPYDSAAGSLAFDWAAYARQTGWQLARPGFGVKDPTALAQIGASAYETFGPELAFAQKLNEFLLPYNQSGNEARHHIVKLAIAGTSLQYHWLPADSDNFLFNRLLEMTVDAINSRSDVRLKVRGMLWLQGETDGDTAALASAYGHNLGRFRNNFEQALAAQGCGFGIQPMPLLIGRLKLSEPLWPPYTYLVREQQDDVQRVPARYGIAGNVGIISTDDLVLLANSPLHFDTASQIQIGYRFFDALFSDEQLLPQAFLFERSTTPALMGYFTNGRLHYCSYPTGPGGCDSLARITTEYRFIRYDMKYDGHCAGPCP